MMRPKSWLVEKYGLGVADAIIAEKRAMQAKRQPHEPQYCMRNPDLPNSEESWKNIPLNLKNILYRGSKSKAMIESQPDAREHHLSSDI